MKPVKTSRSNVVYRGPTVDIGDAWCERRPRHDGWPSRAPSRAAKRGADVTAQPRPPERPEPAHLDPLYIEEGYTHTDRHGVVHVAVRRLRDHETREEAGRGVATFAWILVAVAIVAVIALLVATPRQGQPPTASPTAGSGPGGAPQLSEPGMAPTGAGGAPQVLVATERWAGTATFYCATKAQYPPNGSRCTRGYSPGDMVAAIDTDLGIPKGARVTVRAFGRSVTVRIIDVCACAGERLIDLTSGAFRRLAPLEAGVIPVTIELASRIPRGTLPPTDAETER